MEYEYIYNWEDHCVQIDKQKSILRKKSEYEYKKIKKEDCKCNFPLSQITSNDIDMQLANVKHIGFEVIDSCNLHCKYLSLIHISEPTRH